MRTVTPSEYATEHDVSVTTVLRRLNAGRGLDLPGVVAVDPGPELLDRPRWRLTVASPDEATDPRAEVAETARKCIEALQDLGKLSDEDAAEMLAELEGAGAPMEER